MNIKALFLAVILLALIGVGAAVMNYQPSSVLSESPDNLLGLEIQIPGLDGARVVIEERDAGDGETFFLGAEYVDPEDEAVRAFVSTNAGTGSFDAGNGLLLIPFIVNYGGTGSFVYIGLFEDTLERRHLSSLIVDDRVSVTGFDAIERDLFVSRYLTRRSGEAMASEPTVPATVGFTIEEGALIETFRIINGSEDNIVVGAPAANEILESPFLVEGEARGPWFFEASFPVVVLSEAGEPVTVVPAQAVDEWMTENFVPFEAVVDTGEYEGPAVLIFQRDNPSDLVENNAALLMPIEIIPAPLVGEGEERPEGLSHVEAGIVDYESCVAAAMEVVGGVCITTDGREFPQR